MDYIKAFQKLNPVAKTWLKLTDKKKYKLYKRDLAEFNRGVLIQAMLERNELNTLDKIIDKSKFLSSLNINHSGNAGDIMYSLPTIKRIREEIDIPINLYLKLDQPLVLPHYFKHPLGAFMLNRKMAEMLIPLLHSLPYIDRCEVYNGQEVHLDFDDVRTAGFALNAGNIARWYGYITGVNANLCKNWISIAPDQTYRNSIIIARSERYRNPYIDYSFLKKYGQLYFIGVASEYEDIRKSLPGIEWLQVNNFLEMAQIISGCKFFIGNQSFPFSVAESLKVPRILETSFEAPNVIPEGPNGYDFYFQGHFESLVRTLGQ